MQDSGAILAAMADPLVVISTTGELLWGNRAAEERFGWTLEEMAGHSMVELVHPDDLDTAVVSLASVQQKTIGTLIEIRLRDRSGDYSWFEIRGRPTPDAVVLNLRDTTARRQWELAAGDELMLRAILDAAPAILMLVDGDGKIRGANRALTRMLHGPLEDITGSLLSNLAVADDRRIVDEAIAEVATSDEPYSFEARFETTGEDPIPLSLSLVNLLADRAVNGIVVSAHEIRALVEARAWLQHLATHDDLTGLPNRSLLRSRLHDLAVQRAGSWALLFADIDELKVINDHYGHTAGDVVLQEVALRICAALPATGFAGRVGGDEFVVVVESPSVERAGAIAADIERAVGEPIELPNGEAIELSISIGTTLLDPSADLHTLLSAADEAMYVTKRARRSAARNADRPASRSR